MAKMFQCYGIGNALNPVLPPPIPFETPPTSSQSNYEVGQVVFYPPRQPTSFYIYAGAGNWIDFVNGSGGISTFNATFGSASPSGGVINIIGASAIAGNNNPVVTQGSGNTITVEVQISEAIASSDATKVGLASFNSADFTVDANGFVSSTGSSSSISITGDSGGTLTGSSFTFTGGSTGLTFAGSGTTETLTGIVSLSNGGTNANLTASNGGIFYSTASGGAILSGTSTANQVLLSGSTTAPAWSTATYPSSSTINQLLYSSANNVITGLATANSGTLITSATGVPSIATLSDGQIIIGSSSGAPAAANITSIDSSVTITNGANSINLSVPAAGGLSLGAFGSVPNANGLSLSAGVLNMQPADATRPGGISTVAQTFAGVKTFASSPILPLTGILIGNGAGAVTADSILPVTLGGTGLATLTTHSVMLGQATANVAFADPTSFSVGNPLVSQGGGADPAFSTTATVNQISIINIPVNPSDGVNKNYADLIAAGFIIKASAAAATTANLTATYNNGAAGVGATLTNSGAQAAFAVDGYTASLNDRILVKNQATQAQNGIYSVTTVGSGATNWVLTRTTDYDTIAEIIPGSMVPVINGSVNAGTFWTETNTVTVIGTDPIAFNEFGVNASQFLQKANNLSDVASAATSRSNLGITNIATQSVTQHAVLVGGAANAITSVGAVATTGQILQANTGADPSYSTAAYPSTTTINQLLYSSAANTVTGLATVNDGVLISGNTGIPSWLANTGTTGFVLTGTVGSPPSWSAITSLGAITSITGNSGGAQVPSAGNFNILGSGSITVVGSANTETVQLTGLTNHALQIGAGTATLTQLVPGTTGQILQTNTGADPTWSTATYPSATTINQILYSSAANTVSGLATVNNGTLFTSSTGAPGIVALTDGQVLIGSSSGKPLPGTLTAGTGISITNASNSITISATGTTTLTVTPVNFAASPYTVLGTDEFLAVQSSGGAITIRLPNAPVTGRVYTIKDSTGNASTNNISVTTVGGTVTIDGVTSFAISSNYQAINVIFTGAAYSIF